MYSTEFTITRDGDDLDLDIEYDVAPIDPGCPASLNYPGDPPSGGEVEGLEASQDGTPIELTSTETEAVEAHIYATHDFCDY